MPWSKNKNKIYILTNINFMNNTAKNNNNNINNKNNIYSNLKLKTHINKDIIKNENNNDNIIKFYYISRIFEKD